jgi:hypothetical protein
MARDFTRRHPRSLASIVGIAILVLTSCGTSSQSTHLSRDGILACKRAVDTFAAEYNNDSLNEDRVRPFLTDSLRACDKVAWEANAIVDKIPVKNTDVDKVLAAFCQDGDPQNATRPCQENKGVQPDI